MRAGYQSAVTAARSRPTAPSGPRPLTAGCRAGPPRAIPHPRAPPRPRTPTGRQRRSAAPSSPLPPRSWFALSPALISGAAGRAGERRAPLPAPLRASGPRAAADRHGRPRRAPAASATPRPRSPLGETPPPPPPHPLPLFARISPRPSRRPREGWPTAGAAAPVTGSPRRGAGSERGGGGPGVAVPRRAGTGGRPASVALGAPAPVPPARPRAAPRRQLSTPPLRPPPAAADGGERCPAIAVMRRDAGGGRPARAIRGPVAALRLIVRGQRGAEATAVPPPRTPPPRRSSAAFWHRRGRRAVRQAAATVMDRSRGREGRWGEGGKGRGLRAVSPPGTAPLCSRTIDVRSALLHPVPLHHPPPPTVLHPTAVPSPPWAEAAVHPVSQCRIPPLHTDTEGRRPPRSPTSQGAGGAGTQWDAAPISPLRSQQDPQPHMCHPPFPTKEA